MYGGNEGDGKDMDRETERILIGRQRGDEVEERDGEGERRRWKKRQRERKEEERER